MNKLLLTSIVSLALVGCASSDKAPVASAPAANQTTSAPAKPSVAKVEPAAPAQPEVKQATAPTKPPVVKKAPLPSVLWQASTLAKPTFQSMPEPEAQLLWSTPAEPSARVQSIAYSPNGKLASGLYGGVIRLWDASSGALLQTIDGHVGAVRWLNSDGTVKLRAENYGWEVTSLTYSADGKTLASGSTDNTVKLWDAETGKLLRTFRGQKGIVLSVALAPNGKTLASGYYKAIKLWDASSGKLLRTLEGHDDHVLSVSFASDGNTLASGSSDKTIKLWDVRSGEILRTLEAPISVESVAFSPDGAMLASGGWDNNAKLWNVSSGKLLRTLKGHTNWVKSVAFAPDGKTLASGGLDKTIKIWDAHSGELLRTIDSEIGVVENITFANDGYKLAASHTDHTVIKLWDTQNGKPLLSIDARGSDHQRKGHTESTGPFAFASDGEKLASSSYISTKIWDKRSGELLHTLDGRQIGSAPDGNTIALRGYAGRTIKLWDIRNGELLKTLEGHTDYVKSIAFTANGEILASTSNDKTIKLWSAQNGELLHTLEGGRNNVSSLRFSPNGDTIASASYYDDSVKLWDTNSGELLHTLEGHSGEIHSIIFTPNGNTVASASDSVKLWDTDTGELLNTLEGGSPSFTPDGNTLILRHRDTITLWEMHSGELLTTLNGHTEYINLVALTPDGRILASSSSDKTIKLWKVRSGELLNTLEGHTNGVSSITLTSDGRMLASTGHYDNTIKLWDVRSGKLLITLEGHTSTVGLIAFTPDGRMLASGSWDKTVKLWRVPALERAWNAFVADYNAGQAGLAELQQLQSVYPEFQSQYQQLAAYTEIQQLASADDKPAAIQAYVDKRLQDYSAADYDIAPITQDVPQRGEYPPLPLTVKDQYEKTATFQARGQKAEAEYRAQVARIDADYERAIAAYNAEIERYNSDLAAAQAARSAQLAAQRREYIGEAMALAYGAPQIANTAYDADNEVFHAELVGASGGFTEKVKIPVPIDQARALGENNQEAQVAVRFIERAGGVLSLDDVRVAFRKQEYSGELTRENYQFVAEVSTVDAQPANDQRLALLSVTDAPQAINVDDYFIETLKLENDPEAERVLAEIAAEKERALALQRERQQAALRQKLEDQLAELRQRNRGVADPQIARAVAAMPTAETNARAWLLAIGVEDYMAAPDVPYADNSLELVSAALAKRFGIPAANQIVLQGERASGTFIRGNIRNTLQLLGPEDTLYFYYSGHGMPSRNGTQLYLAPRDIVVAAFEDEDFAFANLLGEIQQARVGKVMAFLDTCFSGKAKADELVFPDVAPIMVSAEQQIPDKMTVFYAATGAQFANSYADKGHRLFSYFLAQGLIDGLATVEDLGRYVSANVAQQARAKGVIYQQEPFVDGRGGKL